MLARHVITEDEHPSPRPQLQGQANGKKKRTPGACDVCKRKKIRCNSGEMPCNRCSHCIQSGLECTHKEVTKTLGPAKGYVESLEARLEKMDKLLTKLLPGVDVNQDINGFIESEDDIEPHLLPRNDDDSGSDALNDRMVKLRIDPTRNRFFGKSSAYQLVQTALDLRKVYAGEDLSIDKLGVIWSKRSEFWEIPPWITSPALEDEWPSYVFPDDDLMPSLIDAYFVQINYFLPLLHRPTLEKSIREGLHRSDPLFGGTVLLVCALGSRYSDDSRVFVENSGTTRSAGWKWFNQVNVLRKSLFKMTSLYELQMHVLFVLFIQTTETPQGVWTQIGMALRLAQEVGAHRKRRNKNNEPNAEDELWKRAFWVIVTLDRLISTGAGRPCGLQDEDFDLDLPLECDDEYWENGFQQPSGKPSTIAFFNRYLNLLDILAYAMRVVYSIRQPRNVIGRVAQRSQQQIIAELDSAMNNWMDLIPSHLRWKPIGNNNLFVKQSAVLYATYYHLQIFIHRPFIPSPRNPQQNPFPSLAICTNAARSCCHVLEAYSKISALPHPHLQVTTFTAAVILLLNMWSGKRSGAAPHPRREMEDVRRCMQILKASETRWSSAGRYLDILTGLACAGDLTILYSQSDRQNWIPEKEDISICFSPSPSVITDAESNQPSTPNISQSIPDASHLHRKTELMNFSLPMYSNELGRIPVYGQINFSDSTGMTEPNNMPDSGFPVLSCDNQSTLPSQPMYPSFNAFTPSGNFLQRESLLQDVTLNSDSLGHSKPQNTIDFAMGPSMNATSSNGYPSALSSPLMFNRAPMMDHDTMTMWSTAPTGFELDEWGTYLSNVGQMTYNQAQTPFDENYAALESADVNM